MSEQARQHRNNQSHILRSMFAMKQHSLHDSQSSNCDASTTSIALGDEPSRKRLSFGKKLKLSFRSKKRLSTSSSSIDNPSSVDEDSDWLSKEIAKHLEENQNDQASHHSLSNLSSNPFFGHVQSQRSKSRLSSSRSCG